MAASRMGHAMGSYEDYVGHALRCEQLAEAAKLDSTRQAMLATARIWWKMAAEVMALAAIVPAQAPITGHTPGRRWIAARREPQAAPSGEP
jgi:hypothetical protein